MHFMKWCKLLTTFFFYNMNCQLGNSKRRGWMNEGRYFSINSGALWYLAKPPPYTGAPSWSNSRGSPVKFLQLLSEFCSVHAAPRQIFTTLKNIFLPWVLLANKIQCENFYVKVCKRSHFLVKSAAMTTMCLQHWYGKNLFQNRIPIMIAKMKLVLYINGLRVIYG